MKVTKLEKTLLSLAMSAAFMPMAAMADYQVQGPMPFDPIPGSAYGHETDPDLNATPWIIPEGYSQSIVSDENDLNIYVDQDWNDMNTVNETKKFAGRYLYRTHEVRGANSARLTPNLYGQTSGGAVSVVDLLTGEAKEIVGRADWEALDGLVWTPWHTVLFAEEVITAALPDPDAPQATSGLVYELKLKDGDPTAMESVTVLPKLGSLSHEGLEIDDDGNVYVIDEDRRGSIYKFVPTTYGNLTEGQLYALKVDAGKTGSAQWMALDMDQAQISARVAATAVGATQFCRPEDMERIAETLYVALTCEDVDNAVNTSGRGAVLAVTLGETPSVSYVVAAGKNAPIEDQAAGVTGFKGVDNLANGPDGKLWMVEDNAFSDIWVYDPASADTNGDGYKDGIHLFASLKDKSAEGTGIYFGKDPKTLFVNVQHSGTGNDKTMAITKNAE
jgi:hypothetical protein